MFKLVEGLEVIGCEYFPLNDGEVNFNLIEPTGMDWGVYEEQVGPLRTGWPRWAEQLSMIQKARRADLYGSWLITS